MGDDADEKVIGMGWANHLGGRARPAVPSPGEILDNPAAFVPRQTPGPERERPTPPAPPGEDGDPGGGPESFDPEGTDYKAYGRAGNKTMPTLRVILKDGSEWPIVYAHLDTHPLDGSRFLPSLPGRKGNVMRLRVAGQSGVFLVVIEGVRLRRVWELIMGHQTPWIHELPPGAEFVRDGEPVIWSVTAGPVRRKAAGGADGEGEREPAEEEAMAE
jgi:hypothetical protein